MKHEGPLGGGRGTFLEWSPDECVAAAEFAIARLRHFGISGGIDSRLARALDLVRRAYIFDIQYSYGDRTTEIAVAEAQRTIFEMFLIMRGLQPPDGNVKNKLRIMLKGPDVPESSGDDPGRDTQAELFAGAVLRAAGFHVDLGEPDLLITRWNRTWGVAVKRVKSDKQFKTRVRQAQRQLSSQGLYGFIVVNPEVFVSRLYVRDPSKDPSPVIFDKTGDWVGYLEGYDLENRVLAVIALATSFRLLRDRGTQSFQFNVHIHQRFVTRGVHNELEMIRKVAEEIVTSLAQSLGSLSIPKD